MGKNEPETKIQRAAEDVKPNSVRRLEDLTILLFWAHKRFRTKF